jgi:hypothetical protein
VAAYAKDVREGRYPETSAKPEKKP